MNKYINEYKLWAAIPSITIALLLRQWLTSSYTWAGTEGSGLPSPGKSQVAIGFLRNTGMLLVYIN